MNKLLPFQILAILGMAVLYCLLIVLGWVLIPLAAACGAYKKTDDNLSKPYDGPIYHFTWPLMWLWDNKIDGIANRNYKQFNSMFKQICWWSAIRNPVSNLRFVPYLSFKIVPYKIKFIGSFGSNENMRYNMKTLQWFFCWQGVYSCFYKRLESGNEFLLGWKVYPKDMAGLEKTHYRFESTGFGIQPFKLK